MIMIRLVPEKFTRSSFAMPPSTVSTREFSEARLQHCDTVMRLEVRTNRRPDKVTHFQEPSEYIGPQMMSFPRVRVFTVTIDGFLTKRLFLHPVKLAKGNIRCLLQPRSTKNTISLSRAVRHLPLPLSHSLLTDRTSCRWRCWLHRRRPSCRGRSGLAHPRTRGWPLNAQQPCT